ncbi:hypothetical protein NMG60_11005459 [Bertholletia excelsa]
MEIKEVEKVVVSKPVPSRPTCSDFRSFSELLASAINSAPTSARPETAVTAIKPKTLRFKPLANHASLRIVPTQAEVSCPSGKADKILSPDQKCTVIYKPLAKVVSKTLFSPLATLGNSNMSNHQALSQIEAHDQSPNQLKQNIKSDLSSNLDQDFPSQTKREKAIKPPKTAKENLQDDKQSLAPVSKVDRPSYDGYGWRKYGQKQVKGSEYPRSYYKCTQPNCPVKKKVERSVDGQIAEIVYEGEHNHARPHPPKKGQGPRLVSDGNGQETKDPLLGIQINERNECSEDRIENLNEGGLLSPPMHSGKALLYYEPVALGAIDGGLRSTENCSSLGVKCEEGSKRLEAEQDEPRSKRRKHETEPSTPAERVQEAGTAVQNSTDSEIIGDGFRWRKYGQKVVKGSPYPRSYYRCTNVKCTVRKYVERACDDPKAYITTYEGKHNHDMPLKNTNPSSSSQPDGPAAKSDGKT